MLPATADPFFDMKDLFRSSRDTRIPHVAVAPDGTVLAFNDMCGLVRRSDDQGQTWGDTTEIESRGGNVVVDEVAGEVLVLRPRDALLRRSADSGRTWLCETVSVRPNAAGHGSPDCVPADVSCSESGICLRSGEHAGRLVMPARVQPPHGDNAQEFWAYNYNTSIYSDDHGRTWQVGEPVQSGTGEGTLAELSDGRLYYNSRCHMAVDARRRIAWSHDGGHRWVDWQVCDTLKEVGEPFYFKYGTRPSYGCNAGLVRVPHEATGGRDVLVYSAPDNPGRTRVRMTVWASFDGAGSWSAKRLVYGGPSAYSSLAADRSGLVYLVFERGLSANPRHDIDHSSIALARFNVAWLLAGAGDEP